MLQDFKKFILRGNVVDMAVGIVIGTAFKAIVTSLVNDILMPFIGLLLGGTDFVNQFFLLKEGSPAAPYISLAEAKAAGAITINYGTFINIIIDFIIVALIIFMLIRALNKMKKEEEAAPAPAPSTKECPYCLSNISIKATRCAHCTSELPTG